MKQRDYYKVCQSISETCALLSAKFQAEGNRKMSDKLSRLAYKFNKLSEIKINLHYKRLGRTNGIKK